MLCASGQCYPQVFGLFLFTPLRLRKPLACSIHLVLNSTFPLLNTACLPHACVPAVSPHGSDLSALQWHEVHESVTVEPRGPVHKQLGIRGILKLYLLQYMMQIHLPSHVA
jgi:hypothetical protein